MFRVHMRTHLSLVGFGSVVTGALLVVASLCVCVCVCVCVLLFCL